MQDIQKELKDIDLKSEHYETRLPVHMNLLLENLSNEQTKEIKYYRMEKWVDPEDATKKDVFKMCLIIIKKSRTPTALKQPTWFKTNKAVTRAAENTSRESVRKSSVLGAYTQLQLL